MITEERATVDPITAEIVRNYLETTCEEIMTTMIRSSVSPIFNEAHDCSAGVFYYDGDDVSLVARADSVPVHIYACLTSVEACLDFFHGDLADGDVIIVSDPFFGGTHIADYTIVKPVFFEGRPLFFPSVRGHVLDVGGPVPGGANMAAHEIWQEGFRFSPMKLVEAGRPRREIWDLLRTNNRLPEMVVGDIQAMIGACDIGEQRIRALAERYGEVVVSDCVEWILDYSERQFRERICSWPAGRYKGTSTLDSDFAGRHDVKVEVTLEIAGGEIMADFAGSSSQAAGVVNSVPPNTLSYLYGVFSALCPDIPLNSGFFRPLSAALPEGSVVNPNPPSAASYATVCIGADIGEAIMKACEGFVPELVGSAVVDLLGAFVHGVDARTGKFFVLYDFYACPVSTSGVKGVDGWGAFSPLFCALQLPSIEMTEVQYPVIYRRAEQVIDTAAPGQWRGSPAFEMEREPYNSLGPHMLNVIIQAHANPLHGWVGGRPGAGNFAILRHGTENEEMVTEVAFLVPQDVGEPVYFHKGGGGGWGDPLDRDPAAVLTDVRDGLVSREAALADYGVHLDDAGRTVLGDETLRERTTRREGS
jgi:N-methylhydantoinase B